MSARTGTFSSLRNSTRLFARDEDGSFIIFTLFILVVMVLIGGLAVDVMRYENLRTTMQNTIDRAVLAAADRDQTVPAQTVVDDYLMKAGMPVGSYEVTVAETTAGSVVTSRRVSVEAEASLATFFMHMMGTPSISAPAASTAEEGINRIEVSLVLDVSGSMNQTSASGLTKLAEMQNAAKTFVTEILTDVEPDQVSINVIPYSTQVNAGPDLLAHFANTAEHNFSHCLNFSGSEFSTMAMDPTVTRDLTGHFDPWSGYWEGTFARMADNGISPHFVCRNEAHFQIQPWANSIAAIHSQIDQFTADGNTSIDVAVKWGAALLDPSTRPVFNALRGTVVSGAFPPGRPYDHDPDDDVLKFIVVMTDGINTTQYYLRDSYRSGASGVWFDPDTGVYSFEDEEWQDYDGDGDWNEAVWRARNYNEGGGRFWIDDIYDEGDDDDNAYELTWPQLWSQMSMSHRAFSHFYERYWNANHYYEAYYSGSNAPRRGISASTKDARLDSICAASKAQDVIVFAVGFEVTDYSAGVMQSCASSGNHFYRVDGLDIENAFQSIANQINQLKLTQ